MVTHRSREGGLAMLWGASVTVLLLGVLTLIRAEYALAVLAQGLIRLTPGGISTAAIERLGHAAQALFGLGVSVAFLLVSWFVGRIVLRPGRTSWLAATAVMAPWWIAWMVSGLFLELGDLVLFGAATAAAVAVGGWAASASLATRAVAPARWRPEAGGPADAAGAEGMAAAPEPGDPGPAAPTAPAGPVQRMNIPADNSRRMLLKSGLLGVAGIAIAASNVGSRTFHSGSTPVRAAMPTAIPSPSGSFDRISGLSPLYTPNDTFYNVDEALFDPMVDLNSWRLTISGLVDHELSFSYDDLLAMQTQDMIRLLACISNTVGGDLAGNAVWTGVFLPELLDRAGVRSEAVEIVFTSVDGFSSSHPVDHAMSDEAMIAVAMNGMELPTKHGFPARVFIPNTYGMKNPKWLTKIELVPQPVLGYWESRGWSNIAEILTQSRIDTPRTAAAGKQSIIAGVAWGGDRSVSKVEVSTDGGTSWDEADLEPPVSDQAWVRWMLDWTPERSGDALLVVRATDGEGMLQTEAETDSHPDGAHGWHRVGLRVA